MVWRFYGRRPLTFSEPPLQAAHNARAVQLPLHERALQSKPCVPMRSLTEVKTGTLGAIFQ
jgi:hypothetical protein